MRLRFMIALLVLMAAAATAAIVGSARSAESSTGASAVPDQLSVLDSTRGEAAERDRMIAFYERRLVEDPASALDLAQLAGHYLQRARETGSPGDLVQAEQAARRSLALRVNRNAKTYVTLSGTLLAQHRFRDAEQAARLAVEYDPEEPAYWSLFAEVSMERGEYAAAAGAFDTVRRGARSLSSTSRLARWAELNGRTTGARTLLQSAVDLSRSRRDLAREQRAWYYLQLGEFEARHGQVAAADSILRAGLALAPNDHRVLNALAKTEAARGRWRQAINYGDRALAITLDPGTLAVMSDAYAALGDSSRAEEFADGVRIAALGQPGPLHREWGLFLLDRDIGTADILRRLRAELADRADVHTEDLLGWALHKSGRDAAAATHMRKAVSLGTESAVMLYHLGEIERSLGNVTAAREAFVRARTFNRYYRPAAIALARLPRSGSAAQDGVAH